jgi:hypothetical protein
MEHSARIFNCLRCHCQVIICSHCDRGNIYCGSICSQEARLKSVRAAGKRYQNTFRGKLKHARRQKRYRERKLKKVTHHTSHITTVNVLLPPDANESTEVTENNKVCCHFCGCLCNLSLRVAVLAGNKIHVSGFWPLGP